jgi:hypothetical protein
LAVGIKENNFQNREFGWFSHMRPFLADAICSHPRFADERRPRIRYGEVFWRAHHEAWKQSSLNQREYCEAHGIPLKAFWQLASEVPGRTGATDAEASVSTREP